MAPDTNADRTPPEDCFACSLSSGRLPLLGGQVHRTERWIVGPLEVGTLIVKPARHVCHVADLNDAETSELGPLLRTASSVVTDLCTPDQVYVCLWSHKAARPVHIHFVIEPVQRDAVLAAGATGPTYQSMLFGQDTEHPAAEIESFCDRARSAFAAVGAGPWNPAADEH